MRSDYHGHAIDDRFRFDADLLENVIIKMKRGKAAGLDGITTEHVSFVMRYYHVFCLVCLI